MEVQPPPDVNRIITDNKSRLFEGRLFIEYEKLNYMEVFSCSSQSRTRSSVSRPWFS